MSDDLLKRMGSFVGNHCLHADCSVCELVSQAMFEIERLSDPQLAELADGFARLNAPDQGMTYTGATGGDRRYNETTGDPYYTRPRASQLTVYGERAEFLHKVIQRGPEIAAALRARSAA